MTAVQLAAASGSLPTLNLLETTTEARLETEDDTQMNLLHTAAHHGSLDCLSYLLTLGLASTLVYAEDASGQTPLFHAVSEEHRACVVALQDAGPLSSLVLPDASVLLAGLSLRT